MKKVIFSGSTRILFQFEVSFWFSQRIRFVQSSIFLSAAFFSSISFFIWWFSICYYEHSAFSIDFIFSLHYYFEVWALFLFLPPESSLLHGHIFFHCFLYFFYCSRNTKLRIKLLIAHYKNCLFFGDILVQIHWFCSAWNGTLLRHSYWIYFVCFDRKVLIIVFVFVYSQRKSILTSLSQ